ncbi:uncharacterized protein HD556DRAFT_1308759 [Suillus plorans]|uniref:Uncharacterized protein n=1 Tax=Suillus plorans TaxID=116603 RepID=A0A9P7DHQ7_9AGAM|nr:uncharacterized protein HD556DRAFT_1308759 [Suillus plorans]KAG1793332.1 hypothetical protein HD556DRAFT_1308759 [Suillus plorans]
MSRMTDEFFHRQLGNINSFVRVLHSERMSSDVFSSGASMGTMPKQTVTQADYYWAQSNSAATAATTLSATNRWQIMPLVRRAAQGMLAAMKNIWAAAASLVAMFRVAAATTLSATNRWQIMPLVRRAAQGMLAAMINIWAAAASLVTMFRVAAAATLSATNRWQIMPLVRRAAQGMLAAVRNIWAAAANLVAMFRRDWMDT